MDGFFYDLAQFGKNRLYILAVTAAVKQAWTTANKTAMNTPAHIAASVLVWRNEPGWANATAVTLGAVLPDLPMFGL